MTKKTVINLITEDPSTGEYVLYLVEDGPWDHLRDRLTRLQERIYDALDIVLDGHLAARFPQSLGKNARIQVDLHDDPPDEVVEFVARFREQVRKHPSYENELHSNRYVGKTRIVTGAEMGRESSR